MTANEYVTEIVKELGLARRAGGVLYGEADGAILTLKVVDDAPLCLLFKVRYDGRVKPSVDIDDGLRSLVGNSRYEVDLHHGYAWLSFYDTSNLEVNKLLAFLHGVIAILRDAGYIENSDRCLSCARETGDLKVVCVDDKVSRLCADCLDSRIRQKRGAEERANKEEPAMLLLVLPALLLSAVSWTAFWVGYDKLFELLGTEEIWLPQIVIVAVLVAFGAVAARPLGEVLRKSGVLRYVPLRFLLPLFLGFIVFAGEVLYFWFSLDGVSLPTAATSFIALVRCYGAGLIFFKLCLLAGLGGGVAVYSAKVREKLAV